MDGNYIFPQDYFPPQPEYWSKYGPGPGVTVMGWPSQGGFYWLRVCSRVEIEFLELDPFNNTLRPPISDLEWRNKKNAHCNRSKSSLLLLEIDF